MTVDGRGLRLDGDPFRFVGANCYYLMQKARDGDFAAVDQVLDDAQGLGVRVIRTWAFYDGPGGFQTSSGVYDDTYLTGLDYVVKGAADRDLKLILPFTNYWSDYGGMPQNVAWDLGISVGAAESQRNEFYYESADSWARYQDTVSRIMNHENALAGDVKYKDDDTIMAWELANEPRASTWANYGTPAADRAAYLNWIEKMSGYVKSLDPDTIVTVGTEGMDTDYGNFGNEQTDFVDDQAFSAVDVAVAHSWPETWSQYYGLTSQAEYMAMLSAQAEDALKVLKKPFVLEEFGYSRDAGGGTTTRDDWFDAYFQTAYDSGAAGAMFWIMYDDDYPDYDGYGVYSWDASTLDLISTWATTFSTFDIDHREQGAIPEPGTVVLLLVALAGAVAVWRRRNC